MKLVTKLQFALLLVYFCCIVAIPSSLAQIGTSGNHLPPAIVDGATAPKTPDAQANQTIPGQYIVVLKEDSADRSLKDKPYAERQRLMKDVATTTLKRNNLQGKKVLNIYGTALKGFSVSGLNDADAEKLRGDARVAYIEQDRMVFLDNNGGQNSSPLTPGKVNTLMTMPPPSGCGFLTVNGQAYDTGSADFGQNPFNVTGDVVLVDDGTAPTSDACQAVQNDVSGKVALLDRGTCEFGFKALQAQNAGAIAVIIANNIPGAPPGMSGGVYGSQVTIPVISVSLDDGNTIKTALNNGPVSATLDNQLTVQCTPWGIARVGGGLSGAGKRAWIIDTGIDFGHPDLNVNTALSTFYTGASAQDEHGHGTHVAGTVAAKDNAFGVIGVAAGAEVVAVRVLNAGGSGATSWVIAGINYVAANAAAGDVANMSLGGGVDAALDAAVLAASATCPFVLAAGNDAGDANNHSPARVNGPNVYTVSAMDVNDNFASFSNYGNPPIDFCEPGVNVLSCWLNGGYNIISGTSMAAPHLSGLLLLGNVCGLDFVNGDPDGDPDKIGVHSPDNDGDGFQACDDCDDNDASVYPGAPEICDGKDNDCDGLVDSDDPDFVDNTPPTVACKPYTAVLDGNGQASITMTDVYDAANSGDNCGTINLLNVTPSSFDCSNIGPNTVTLFVNDGNGNFANCTATVTVDDNTAPTAVCQNATVQLDVNGSGSIAPADVFDSGTDNCGAVNPESVTPATFGCGDVGTNTITLTVNDGYGNTASCSATVTVEDNVPPVANCKNFTTALNADGYYTLAPANVDDGSSDACGIQSLSVSPNQFDCGDEGANTVTLTVTDDNGNSASCIATVTITPFVTITGIVATDETCAGTADGTITINATAVGGTLVYSITGGNSYQSSNTFINVSPGVYSVVVLAQGTSGCSATGTAVVYAGGMALKWYKDLDNDGYSDGIFTMACSHPPGYKLGVELIAYPIGGNVDCNDNDPNQFPGQTWYKDTDNDGWSNGTMLVQCNRPAGCKAVGELTGTSGDCNDANAAINPGATEICNGIDDNCNGQIDEGASGGLTYVGNVTFTTQAQVDAFSQCYSVIQGMLTIQGAGINSLANLINLTQITGNVTIKFTGLPNMTGLNALTTIGGSLTIQYNNYGAHLTSLNGLGALTSIGANLIITTNVYLSDCCSIEVLLAGAGVGGATIISGNAFGCQSVAQINTACGGSIIAPPNTGVSLFEQVDEARMEVFPNPASNSVTVLLEGMTNSETTLTIFDQMGRTVFVQRLAEGQSSLTLDLNDGLFRNGIYMVSATTDGQRLTKRLVVAR